MRTAVRPDKIRAFKREVWANCPAAPAAVSAARADHCKCGKVGALKTAVVSRKTCLARRDRPSRGDARMRI